MQIGSGMWRCFVAAQYPCPRTVFWPPVIDPVPDPFEAPVPVGVGGGSTLLDDLGDLWDSLWDSLPALPSLPSIPAPSPPEPEDVAIGVIGVGVGIIIFDIVTIPSGEGLIGVGMIAAAF